MMLAKSFKSKSKAKNPDEFTPDEDDIYIFDSGTLGSKTSVSASSKFVGEYASFEEAEKAIEEWTEKNKIWPNIWYVDDHGGIRPYTLEKFKKNPDEENKEFFSISFRKGSHDHKIFDKVINQGIDSHLQAFTKSKFREIKEKFGSRIYCEFHVSEIPILIRRLTELDDEEAWYWVDDIKHALKKNPRQKRKSNPRDYVYIGSSPYDEDCAQVGSPTYREQSRKELNAFVRQLKRKFGEPPEGAAFVIKSEQHDFGTYYEVVVAFDDKIEEAMKFAYKVENNSPAQWDLEARKELGLPFP